MIGEEYLVVDADEELDFEEGEENKDTDYNEPVSGNGDLPTDGESNDAVNDASESAHKPSTGSHEKSKKHIEDRFGGEKTENNKRNQNSVSIEEKESKETKDSPHRSDRKRSRSQDKDSTRTKRTKSRSSSKERERRRRSPPDRLFRERRPTKSRRGRNSPPLRTNRRSVGRSSRNRRRSSNRETNRRSTEKINRQDDGRNRNLTVEVVYQTEMSRPFAEQVEKDLQFLNLTPVMNCPPVFFKLSHVIEKLKHSANNYALFIMDSLLVDSQVLLVNLTDRENVGNTSIMPSHSPLAPKISPGCQMVLNEFRKQKFGLLQINQLLKYLGERQSHLIEEAEIIFQQ